MDDAGPGGLGFVLVGVHHLADPLHFTGEVAIIRTGFGANLDQRFAIQSIGTNG